mgnify:FL=1|jgi:hypothetical protein|tara:strand:- start:1734 stop:2381 length:648 start_codon:yes stop_codon:yes gene_type:complete
MLRILIKPFKRWAFNRANRYTNYYIDIYNLKYIIKYLKKIKKLAIKKNNILQIELIDILNNEELLNIIVKYKNTNLNDMLNIINNYLINNTNILDIYDYELIYNFSDYIIQLKIINEKDVGLDHSKVREYWLKRGPRIFISSILLLLSNYILYIYLKEIDIKTNIYLIIINIIALFLSIYMLYYRLPDSIESAVARTSHDYYVKIKKKIHNNIHF